MLTDSPDEQVTFKRKFKRAYQRILLRIIGFFFPLRQKNKPPPVPNNILIFVQEKLGDAILTTPLIKKLKDRFPDIQIHLVIFNKASNIFESDANIHQVHNFKANKLATAKKLKKIKFDVLFNTKDHPSFTFIALSRYLNADWKVSLDNPHHRKHFHYLIDVPGNMHIADKNNALMSLWEDPKKSTEIVKPYTPKMSLSEDCMNFIGHMEANKYIGINLSAGSPEREWPLSKWEHVIHELDEQFIVFAVGPRLADKALLEEHNEKVIPSPTTKNIYEAAKIIEKLQLLITLNTGLLHVASCYPIKIVGLYHNDPADYKRFSPYQTTSEMVISDKYFTEKIHEDQVINATRSLLMEKQ